MKKTHKEYLMMAIEIANTYSEDPNTKTGAIIVSNKGEVLATGWNRMPRTVAYANKSIGLTSDRKSIVDRIYKWFHSPSKSDWVKTKYPYIVHAEVACCLDYLKKAKKCSYPVMYMTLAPCSNCVQMIIESGVKEIYYSCDKYADRDYCIAGKLLLEAAGINYTYIEI